VPSFGNEPSVGATETWLTPPNILHELGYFDLDPCAAPNMPWRTAGTMLTEEDDGLSVEWSGRVFMNPPYGRKLPPFLKKLSEYGDGIALVFARTETRAFHDYVWPHADAIMFLKGRLKFFRPDGTQGDSAGAPSCLIAYGERNVGSLYQADLNGVIVGLKGGDNVTFNSRS